jgi:hypothetical protein
VVNAFKKKRSPGVDGGKLEFYIFHLLSRHSSSEPKRHFGICFEDSSFKYFYRKKWRKIRPFWLKMLL